VIEEFAIIALCIYGLLREGDVVKVAAIVSLLAYPALLLFTKSGCEELVLLILGMEAVPFAFALFLLRILNRRDFRVMWK